jgi:hypothetical protein
MSKQSENQSNPDRAQNGTFKKGHEKRGGRKMGTPNVKTTVLNTAILLGQQVESGAMGRDELRSYLRRIARERPAVYAKLLGKALGGKRAQTAGRRVSHIEQGG